MVQSGKPPKSQVFSGLRVKVLRRALVGNPHVLVFLVLALVGFRTQMVLDRVRARRLEA